MTQAAATVALIRERLAAALQPARLDIEDESHLHAGHAGARHGGHYRVAIVSAAFAGKSKLARQRMVFDALGELMRTHIHALGIETAVPGEE